MVEADRERMSRCLSLRDGLIKRARFDDVAVGIGLLVVGTKKAGDLAGFICFEFKCLILHVILL